MESLSHSDLQEIDGYSKVCRCDDLKECEGKRFIVNDLEIAVFKVSGEVFALSNICPHQHTSLICDGFIEDGCVVCPVHGWMFDLRTGLMPTKRSGLTAYPIRIKDNYIFIKADKKSFNW